MTNPASRMRTTLFQSQFFGYVSPTNTLILIKITIVFFVKLDSKLKREGSTHAQCCENGCQVPNLALGKLAWHLAKFSWHLATFSLLRKSVWHLANLFKVPKNHTILNQIFKNFLGEIPHTPFN